MRGLDETDREILRLLQEDGRRPYSEIAATVDLSPPAVSDRVDRLQELGIIERFTVSLDRTRLREGQPILIELDCKPGKSDSIRADLTDWEQIEHVFQTADNRLVCTAVAGGDIGTQLEKALSLADLRSYDIRLLADAAWQPHLDDAELALDCVECGNTVTAQGERERLDGRLYHFCCNSCRERFLDQYERLSDEA